MLAEERRTIILEKLALQNVVKVRDLSKELGATEVTIRHDLDELERSRQLRRVHGGAALLSEQVQKNRSARSDMTVKHQEEKMAIAQEALPMINDNDTILMDASTTVHQLGLLIGEKDYQNLTVITNSILLANALLGKKNLRIIHLGGEIDHIMGFSFGLVARNALSRIRVDKCFLGANGVDPKFGYSVPVMEDAEIKQCMLESAKQRIILADHSKFGESFMGRFAPFHGVIDYLITDEVPKWQNKSVYKENVRLIEVKR